MPTKRAILLYGVIGVLALACTLASLAFVRPLDCQCLCDALPGETCPRGACRAFEQRAGLPLPLRIDDPGWSSPTSGWGILGPEDLLNPMTFALDVLFYGILFRLGWYILQAARAKARAELLAVGLPLALLLACGLLGLWLYAPLLAR